MFNPVTFKVRDSTGRLPCRQWWFAYCWRPIFATGVVAGMVHPYDGWVSFGMLINVLCAAVFIYVPSTCISELTDRAWSWVMLGLAVLLGLVVGTFLYYPDGFSASFEVYLETTKEGYVSPGDWITRGRWPAMFLLAVPMIAISVRSRRRFLREIPNKTEGLPRPD